MEIKYLSEKAYMRQHLALDRKLSYNNNMWKHWNDEQHRRPHNSAGYKYALKAVDKWWHRSIDAGNALAYFEKTHGIKNVS